MTSPEGIAATTEWRNHCITCGGVGIRMRVLAVDDDDAGLARCAGAHGEQPEDVEVALVGPLEVGDGVLVHAGVALVNLTPKEARGLRYVDEFRDGSPGLAVAGEILGAVEREQERLEVIADRGPRSRRGANGGCRRRRSRVPRGGDPTPAGQLATG